MTGSRDNTRWQRKPKTFRNIQQALFSTAKFFRKDLWADADSYVDAWLEKDALAGVVYPITSMYDVPLMVENRAAFTREPGAKDLHDGTASTRIRY